MILSPQPRAQRSALFADDEPVFGCHCDLLPGVAMPVFGDTRVWPATALRRPSNRKTAGWKINLTQQSPVWNLLQREVAFALLNPTHRVLRSAGVFLAGEPISIGTLQPRVYHLGILMTWATDQGLPANLALWSSQDWSDFIDHRAASVKPATVVNSVETVRCLHELAPVLTHGGPNEDPWPGQTSSAVARHTAADEITTPSIPPTLWWPLLRAAWTYIHQFAPDLLDLRDRLREQDRLHADQIPARSPQPARRTRAHLDATVQAWVSDPMSMIPVYDRDCRHGPAGTVAWSTLGLLVTDGEDPHVFNRATGARRRHLAQPLIDAGRVQPFHPKHGITAFGIKAKPGVRPLRTAREADERVAAWLADPANLVPVREHDNTKGEGNAGDPVWLELSRRILGQGSLALFNATYAAPRRRREAVRRVVAQGRVQVLGVDGTHRRQMIVCDGFSTVARPDGTRTSWRATISLAELDEELLMVRAACYAFIAGLSLMRDSEIQEIERGAVTTFHGSPAVRSRKIKHDPTQSQQRWWVIEPVAEAIAVAERLSWHDSHIFATLNPPATGPQRKTTVKRTGRRGIEAGYDIDTFIAGVNAGATTTGLQPIPAGLVRPHMFRKTMSVITGQEPDAEIALGLQLKHAARRAMSNRVTAGYYRADTAWLKEFDNQLELSAAAKLIDLLNGRRHGDPVAVGPGAARLHAGLDRVADQVRHAETDPTLRAQLADPRLEVTLLRNEFPSLHWGTLNHCMWDAEYAECQKALPVDQRGTAPLIGACEPARCRNSAVTRSHAPIWLAEEDDLQVLIGERRVSAPRRASLQARLVDVQLVTDAWKAREQP